jgi:branched-subunit amino acid aminotransferase/4-amino-4-deoxychorismate lyase
MAESDETGLAAGAAWINGTVMPIAEARLPINDWGIIHSDITYDVVPAWDGGFFRLHDYIGRFQNSVAALRLEIGMDRAAIAAALTEMVAASGLRNAYVAMVASRGVPLIPGTRDPRLWQSFLCLVRSLYPVDASRPARCGTERLDREIGAAHPRDKHRPTGKELSLG